MHQSGHSRAQIMQTVQFSSVSAMTPRLRGGSSGRTSGYCAVTARRVIRRNVVASPFARPRPSMAPILARSGPGFTFPRPAGRARLAREEPQQDGDDTHGEGNGEGENEHDGRPDTG